MKLIAFDMDGVIFKHHNFWMELHRELGTLEEGTALTRQYVKTDYPRLVREVIGRLWAGKPAKPYFDLINKHQYVEGAEGAFKKIRKRESKTMIISSGPYDLALRAQRDLEIDYIFANGLPIKDGFIVGTDDMNYWKIKDDSKVEPLEEVREELGLDGGEVIAVVHDKNDIKLARHVREIGGKVIGFMFEPHEEVEKECTTIVRSNDLSGILEHI
ncbi:MAG: HAD-IB family phosphatase [Nanoarchaeota archaeon]